MFEHLCLSEWPFRITPDNKSAEVWADRKDIHRQLELLLRGYTRSPASSINLLWAYFGAGKTHFLRHLASRARSVTPSPVLTEYSVFPRRVRGFLDLYRTLAHNWSAQTLADCYAVVAADGRDTEIPFDADFLKACRVLAVQPDSAQIVMSWLRGDRLLIRDVRNIGVSQKIDTSDRAISVCVSAIRMLLAGRAAIRFVWMVDEFQRIGELRPSESTDVNVGLHSVFNELTSGFSLLLSFSFGTPENIRFLLSDELRDRANMAQYFQLPELDAQAAEEFIADLLTIYRSPDCSGDHEDPFSFPFQRATIRRVVELIDDHPKLSLKPRTLMQVFDAVLGETEIAIETGERDSVDPASAEEVFRRRADAVLDEKEAP
jgi:hypothetical protein